MSRSWWQADPRARIAAIVDPGSFEEDPGPRASPWLARWGLEAHPDDGVVTGRAALSGRPVLVAAQDARFLGGSIGAEHGAALAGLLERALGGPIGSGGGTGEPVAGAANATGVLLLLESGGARLHEANAAEVALARALRAMCALRVAGVPVLALAGGPGGCFGAAAILAGAATLCFLRRGTRMGVSGPRAVEAARGVRELDASDAALVESIYGADTRIAQGAACELPGEPAPAREALGRALDRARPLERRALHGMLERLRERWVESYDPAPVGEPRAPAEGFSPVGRSGRIWVAAHAPVAVLAPVAPAPLGPAQLLALDEALLDWLASLPDPSAWTLCLLEDSPGHEVSARAERACLAQYLASHALVLAWLRAQGVGLRGLLAGTGHSAAFFVNALQAPEVCIVEGSRLEVMAPAAMARVLGLAPDEIDRVLRADPILGGDPQALIALGGARAIVPSVAAGLAGEAF